MVSDELRDKVRRFYSNPDNVYWLMLAIFEQDQPRATETKPRGKATPETLAKRAATNARLKAERGEV